MAKVIRQGSKWNRRYCVAHSVTSLVIQRKGQPVCFTTRGQAVTEANRTQCKAIGGPACKLVR